MINSKFLMALILLVICVGCSKEHEEFIDDIHSINGGTSDNGGSSSGGNNGGSGTNSSSAKINVETEGVEPGNCFAKAYGKISGVKDAVEVGFLYGGTPGLSFENDSKYMSTTAKADYWITLKGVIDDCVNYYRAYALVDGKYYYGQVKSFETYRLTYTINGKEYFMIKVEEGDMGDFSIMQTEMPTDGVFSIYGNQISFDRNENGYISKSELRSFIDEIRKVTGLEFRLPYAEEWLYASKGGKFSKGYLYSGSDNIDEVAWYSENSSKKAHPVAQKKANELGIYDMSGNYSEVVQEPGKDYDYIDGPLYGGNWTKGQYDCKANSWYKGNSSQTKIDGTNYYHMGSIEKMETVRLVYSRY